MDATAASMVSFGCVEVLGLFEHVSQGGLGIGNVVGSGARRLERGDGVAKDSIRSVPARGDPLLKAEG